METINALRGRRAVRSFDPDARLSRGQLLRLLQAAADSPSAFNQQNWRFVVAESPQARSAVAGAAYDQAPALTAAALVAVCADLRAWEKEPARYCAPDTPGAAEQLAYLRANYQDRPQAQRDEAFRSCGIAAQSLMLAAFDAGYGSCPIGGFDHDRLARAIALPDDHVAVLLVAIGKAAGPLPAGAPRLALEHIVFWDRF